jgi:Co/Zn/Cd efflux system component
VADCCEDKACAIDALRKRQASVLKIVLGLNAIMFVVELASGIVARSTALLSDSLDNLGDALTYGLSLYAVARDRQTKARVALFKGILICSAGVFVLGQVAWRAWFGGMPIAETIGVVSVLALIANGTCLTLLWKHREDDVNMSSVWECSRNDILSNLSVLVAAGVIWLTASPWPDLVVGVLLALWFLRSAVRVLAAAIREMRAARKPRRPVIAVKRAP